MSKQQLVFSKLPFGIDFYYKGDRYIKCYKMAFPDWLVGYRKYNGEELGEFEHYTKDFSVEVEKQDLLTKRNRKEVYFRDLQPGDEFYLGESRCFKCYHPGWGFEGSYGYMVYKDGKPSGIFKGIHAYLNVEVIDGN